MSWAAVLGLAAGAYALKAVGFLGLSRVRPRATTVTVVALLPAALLAGLVVAQTAAAGSAVERWTRVAGVTAGAVATWRRAPLLAVIVVAAGVTAALRALAG